MLHIVQPKANLVSNAVCRNMFAARKAVFVDLLRWDVPVIEGRYEIDQFDNAHARYLIVTSPEGRHLSSARLLPTMRAHILGDLYPDLCANSPPRSASTYEITRFCLDRSLRARERRSARNTLINALVDYALETGIETYTAIAERGWLDQIQTFGWRCQALGPVQTLAGRQLGALAIAIDQETRKCLAQAGIVATSAADPELRAAA